MLMPLNDRFDLKSDDTSVAMDFDADLQALEAFLDEYSCEELHNGTLPATRDEAYPDEVVGTAMKIETSFASPSSYESIGSSTDSPHSSRYDGSGTAALSVRQPKPVRRDYRKEEMTRLRWMVQHLTKKLQLLQATPTQSPRPEKKMKHEEHSNEVTSPLKESLWHQITLKQRERRRKSEEENTNLRSMVYTQVLEAKNLRRILKRRTRIEMLENALGIKHRKDLSKRATIPQNNAQVFQDMLRDAEELYPGVESLFTRQGMDSVPCPGQKRKARPNASDGVNFELMQKNLVPFSLQDTERAVWNYFRRVDSGNLQHVSNENAQVHVNVQYREEKEDVMMASFASSASGAKELSGIQIWKVVRRYVKADGTVFICQTLSEPTDDVRGAAVHTSATAQVVVKHATNLGASEGEEVSLILSHVTVSNRVLSDQLSPPTIEGVTAIAIWDGFISRMSNDVESFLLCGSSNSEGEFMRELNMN